MTKSVPPNKRSSHSFLRSTWSFGTLIDQGFFIFAGVVTLWLAWLVFREGWQTGSWWLVALFAIAWLITAYVGLPRLHRILSNLYVPNYFIGRTRTADGLLSDPVNLAFRGTEDQLHKVLQAAGWTQAEEITPRSVWRMITATLLKRSYPNAPVSASFLFGRRHDFAYQQEINGSPSKRHHVRFWQCPEGWLLPGGYRVDWLASATYDRGMGLSFFTFQFTHRVDEDTDSERDYLMETVRKHSEEVRVRVLENFSTGYHSRNGGGDAIRTDGDLPVLKLQQVIATQAAAARPRVMLDATAHDEVPAGYELILQELWSRRPPAILFGSMAVVAVLALMVTGIVFDMLQYSNLAELLAGSVVADNVSYVVRGGLIVLAVIELWLVRRLLAGSGNARIMLLSVASVAAVTEGLRATVGESPTAMLAILATMGLHIVTVLLFSSDSARQFTHIHSSRNR